MPIFVWPCAIERDWPDEADSLSFIEPSIVGNVPDITEFHYYSPPLGQNLPGLNFIYSRCWWQSARYSNETVDEANILEWVEYLRAERGMNVGRDSVSNRFYGKSED